MSETAEQELDRLRKAFRYMADKNNWDIDESGYSIMNRPSPQAGKQVGIFLISAHLSPWAFANEVCPATGGHDNG